MKYLLLITYNFDPDYSAYPCTTELNAKIIMNNDIFEEIDTIKEDYDYKPQVLELDETEKFLVYTEGEVDENNYSDFDYIHYRVIEIGHGVPEKGDECK